MPDGGSVSNGTAIRIGVPKIGGAGHRPVAAGWGV